MNDIVLTERSNIIAVANAIRNKAGITESLTFNEMVSTINDIEASSGIDTSDATAVSTDIMNGKTAYVAGGKVTGSFTIDAEIEQQNAKIAEQDALISQIQTALQGKAAGGDGGASYNVCALNFVNNTYGSPQIVATVVNDGMVETVNSVVDYTTRTIENVICGSCAVALPPTFSEFVDTAIYVDGEEYFPDSEYHCVFTIPNKKDGIVEVVFDVYAQQ